jgi:hypothetical protein
MNWKKWVVLGWLVAECLYLIFLIGKPRKPKTPADAIAAIAECSVIGWLVVSS